MTAVLGDPVADSPAPDAPASDLFSHTTAPTGVVMSPEIARLLRQPFPVSAVGKKPKLRCGACSKAPSRCCDSHEKRNCAECGNWISNAHFHVDYIGHAETTDRLLQVDPWWTWEPFAVDEQGLPVFDRLGCLWIRLTVAGVTRPGYGSADGKTGPDAIKEIIGDALRNAALRFGVAIDLWGASGATLQEDGSDDGGDQPAPAAEPTPPPKEDHRSVAQVARDEVDALATAESLDRARELHELIGKSRARKFSITGLLRPHEQFRAGLGIGEREPVTLEDLAARTLAHWEQAPVGSTT